MAEDKPIKNISAADIEKYHKGLLPAKERHTLERAALEDPFLAEALEGFETDRSNVTENMAELRERLAARIARQEPKALINKENGSTFTWWKIAAMVILVAGAGILIYSISTARKSIGIAEAPIDSNKPVEKIDAGPSGPVNATPDSTAKRLVSVEQDSIQMGRSKASSLVEKEIPNSFAKKTKDPEDAVSANDNRDAPAPAGKTGQNEVQADKDLVVLDKPVKNAGELKAIERDARARDPFNLSKPKNVAEGQRGFESTERLSDPTITQANTFRGRVTDNNNNALPFTNITNLEDGVGTYTDARGYFTLTSPDSSLNVQVRSLGFETNNVQLFNSKQENKISLDEDKTVKAWVLDTVKRNTNRSRTPTMVLEEPEPADGWRNYDTYLVNNLKVPETLAQKNLKGEVELSFDVDKDGTPVNIAVRKSLCESCDREAIRLVKEGPKWKRKLKKRKASVTVSF
jgi:hypothetical protein